NLFLRCHRIPPQRLYHWFCSAALRTGIRDRRPATAGLLPAVHITSARENADEVEALLLADPAEEVPAQALQIIRGQEHSLAKPCLVIVETRELREHSGVDVLHDGAVGVCLDRRQAQRSEVLLGGRGILREGDQRRDVAQPADHEYGRTRSADPRSVRSF